jgi:hypothetical protein
MHVEPSHAQSDDRQIFLELERHAGFNDRASAVRALRREWHVDRVVRVLGGLPMAVTTRAADRPDGPAASRVAWAAAPILGGTDRCLWAIPRFRAATAPVRAARPRLIEQACAPARDSYGRLQKKYKSKIGSQQPTR